MPGRRGHAHQDSVIYVGDEKVEPVRLALVLVQPQPPHRRVSAGLRCEQVVEHADHEQAQQRQPNLAHPPVR